MSLEELIVSRNPKLALNSIKSYASTLRSLFKKMYPNEPFDVSKFDNVNEVVSFIRDIPWNRRKPMNSALYLITQNKIYKEMLNDDWKKMTASNETQEMSPKQKDASISQEDIKSRFEELKKNAGLCYKMTIINLIPINHFILFACMSGIFIEPRRNSDWINMKIKNIDKATDNYIEKNQFVFNTYKTAKTYGQQRIDIPKELMTILKKWIKVNPTEWLCFNTKLDQLTSPETTRTLNIIFGKNTGINAIRHSYLSEKFQPMIELNKEMEESFSKMGSSILQFKTYVKKLN